MLDFFNYEEHVKECKEKRRNVMISNKSLSHASILTEAIVEEAEKKICLLTGACDDIFYKKENIISKFKSFIKKTEGTGKIEIILEKNNEDGNNCSGFIRILNEEYSKYHKQDSLSLYRINDNDLITDNQENCVTHCMIVDDNGPFRFEKHSINKDKTGSERIKEAKDFIIEAKANFGNENISRSLQNYFELFKKKSTLININDFI